MGEFDPSDRDVSVVVSYFYDTFLDNNKKGTSYQTILYSRLQR